MRTLYSVTLLREDGGTTIVDYLDALGWRRHELDPSGAYVGVAPATVASLRPLRDDCAASLVHELREASDALGEALDYAPSGPEAGHDPLGATHDDGELDALEAELRRAVDELGETRDPLDTMLADSLAAGDPVFPVAPPALSPALVRQVRRDRRAVLAWLARASTDGWSDALRRLARTAVCDEREVARATRLMEFMRSTRNEALRALVRDDAKAP
jgi:hypothetical protein